MTRRTWKNFIYVGIICFLLALVPHKNVQATKELPQPLTVVLPGGVPVWDSFTMSNYNFWQYEQDKYADCQVKGYFIMPKSGQVELIVKYHARDAGMNDNVPNIYFDRWPENDDDSRMICSSSFIPGEIKTDKENIYSAEGYLAGTKVYFSLTGRETKEELACNYDVSVCVKVYPDESWQSDRFNNIQGKSVPMALTEKKTGNLYTYGDTDCFELTAGSTNFYAIRVKRTKVSNDKLDSIAPWLSVSKVQPTDGYTTTYGSDGNGNFDDGDSNEAVILYLEPGAKYIVKVFGSNCDYELAIEKAKISSTYTDHDYNDRSYAIGKGRFYLDLANDRYCVGNETAVLKYPLGSDCPKAKFTGKAIKPEFDSSTQYYEDFGFFCLGAETKTHFLNLADLKRNFIISYENNINPGTGYVVLTGKGYLSGTMKIPFKIAQPEVGLKIKVSGATYKVLQNKCVAFMAPSAKSITKLTIPATVKIGGQSYKVTEIASSACKKYTKLKTLVIGTNVAKIGSNAFNGCKNLKTVTIKTKKLKSTKVGKNAFKKLHSKAKVVVPTTKLSSYKKILKAAGITGKKQKIVK